LHLIVAEAAYDGLTNVSSESRGAELKNGGLVMSDGDTGDKLRTACDNEDATGDVSCAEEGYRNVKWLREP
jgi:hypothetical protein